MGAYRYTPAGSGGLEWLTLALTAATKDDASSSEDSGTTDLAAREIGVNTTPSQSAASRSALLYRWPLTIPAGARGLALELPTVAFSVRTNNYAVRFALLDKTDQATSVGWFFDVGTTASADRMGIAQAWSGVSMSAPVVTPVAYRGDVKLFTESSTSKLTIPTLIDLDSGDESGRVLSNVSTVSLAGLSGSTLYAAVVVHTPTGVATTFTLGSDPKVAWVTDP